MKLELIKTKKGTYRIITESNNKSHPALQHIAELLDNANRRPGGIKCGIFSVPTNKFSTLQKVYSYIAKRSETFNRKQYYEWKAGKRTLKQKKPWSKHLTEVKVSDDNDEVWNPFGEVQAVTGKDEKQI